MMVKVFSFDLRIEDPAPRAVRARGAVYSPSGGRLVRVEGLQRQFSPEEDALDFDEDFGATIGLTLADVVHSAAWSEALPLTVAVHECAGPCLKLYEIVEGGVKRRLLMVIGGEDGRRYVLSVQGGASPPRGDLQKLAEVVGVDRREVEKLLASGLESP